MFTITHCFVMDPNNHRNIYLNGDCDPLHCLYTIRLSECVKIPSDKTPTPNIPSIACTILDHPDHSNASKHLLHKRLGHPNFQKLYLMSTQGLAIGLSKLKRVCCYYIGYVKGKHHRCALPTRSMSIMTRPFELVHIDLCGPMPIISHSQAKYFILFIDDYARYYLIYFLRRKSEALVSFKDFTT